MLLGKGRYGAGLNRVSLSFRNRKEIKVRRRAGVAPQATRGKPSLVTSTEDALVGETSQAEQTEKHEYAQKITLMPALPCCCTSSLYDLYTNS